MFAQYILQKAAMYIMISGLYSLCMSIKRLLYDPGTGADRDRNFAAFPSIARRGI